MKNLVLFDLDDTLISYAESERNGLSAALAELGLPSDNSVLGLYQEINRRLWREYAEGEVGAEELRSRRFEELLEVIGGSPKQMVPLREAYVHHFSSSGVPVPGAAALLEELHVHGYRLGIITNGFRDMQRPRIRVSGLEPFFETIIISDEVNLTKPDPRIFQLALDSTGTAREEETFFVGDNPRDDIAGAKSFGFRTIWYSRYRKEKVCPEADFSTKELAQILRIIRG